MMTFINREQLYEQVWKEPFTKLAPKYNTTPVKLRKLCNQFCIPIPTQGHWQKIAFGKEIKTPHLTDYNCFNMKKNSYTEHTKVKQTIPIVATKIMNVPKINITVKQSLSNPHSLIQRTLDDLKMKKADDYGMLKSGLSSVNMRVSPASLKRALRIMDVVLKWFEKHGYTVKISSAGNEQTYILIDEQKVSISIEETSSYVGMVDVYPGKTYNYQRRTYKPTNKLSLLIHSWAGYHSPRKKWSDGKLKNLEEMLPDFIQGMFKFAEAMKANQLKKEMERAEYEAKRLQKQYELKCEELEQKMLAQLDEQVHNWNKSMQLKQYITAVEEKANIKYPEVYPKALLDWFQWAKKYADTLNPLRAESFPFYIKAEDVLGGNDIKYN